MEHDFSCMFNHGHISVILILCLESHRLCHFQMLSSFFSTDRLQFSEKRKKFWLIEFYLIFNFQPTDWTDLARHKSAMQGIN